LNDDDQVKVYDIDVKSISVSHLNVRQTDRKAELDSLASSIRREGQLQPVVLMGSRSAPPPYKLIVGQRRFLAVREILNSDGKHPTVKAVFLGRTISDDEARRLSLAENLQRVSLNAADQLSAITAVFIASGRNIKATARQLGVSDQTIRNWVKLDELATPTMKALMKSKRLRPTDARRVLEAARGDSTKANALAAEIGTRTLPEKQRMVEFALANPGANAKKILSEAAKPSKTRHIMLYLPDDVGKALESAARKQNTASDELVLQALSGWLKTNGYLT
jgi:ParB/RepB/Spo0J family partition protein